MEDVTFEQTPEEIKGVSHPVTWELVLGRECVSPLN